MYKIFWLNSAINDLTHIRDFLLEVNLSSAKKVTKLIKESTNKLQNFPFIGKPVEDLEDFYDLYIKHGAYDYHLRYKIYRKTIYIVHIKHMKELEFLLDL